MVKKSREFVEQTDSLSNSGIGRVCSCALGYVPRLQTDLIVELEDDGTQLTDDVHHRLGIG